MTALSVMGAQWRLKSADRAVLLSEFLPWAVRAGVRSADLMCLYYEEHFEVNERVPEPSLQMSVTVLQLRLSCCTSRMTWRS